MLRRSLLLAAIAAVSLFALPILLGYLEGPRFPVLAPGPWEGLMQVGRNLRFGP